MVRQLFSMFPAAALAVALLVSAAPAHARGTESEIRSVLEDVNARLAQLAASDYASDASQEIEQARLEIAEVQGKLSAQDFGWASIVLNRVAARLALIESMEQRAEVDAIAEERESELFAITREADDAQIELESLQLRRTQLQDDVRAIADAMQEQR
jgi:hypothetical protein